MLLKLSAGISTKNACVQFLTSWLNYILCHLICFICERAGLLMQIFLSCEFFPLFLPRPLLFKVQEDLFVLFFHHFLLFVGIS